MTANQRTRSGGLSRALAGLGLAIVVVLPAGLGAAEAGKDAIVLSDGKRIENVEVVQARWDNVQYKQAGRPAVGAAAGQVVAVERKSDILERIRQVIDSGDLARAADLIKNVPPNQTWVAAEGMYLAAAAQHRAGKLKEAVAAYKEYLDKFKGDKDWFVPFATAGMADALVAINQPGTAEVHYKELATFGPRWELSAKLGQGQAILKSKGAGGALDARRLFDEVVRSPRATVDLKQKAMVGRASAFLLQGQNDQVIKELSAGMFDAPKPEELQYGAERAAASLLMGRAYMAMGGKENLEQAEIWLLRVPALYGKHAEAYSQACDLLIEVYGKLNNAARAAEWKARKAAGAGGGK